MERIQYSLPGPPLGGCCLEQFAFLIRPHGQPAGLLWVVFGGNAMLATDWFQFVEGILKCHAAMQGGGGGNGSIPRRPGGDVEAAEDGVSSQGVAPVGPTPADGPLPAFLLIDYPGYGSNAGRTSPMAVLEASRHALRETLLRLGAENAALGLAAPEVHLLGHSLGCAAASQLAVRLSRERCPSQPPGCLLISAPFLSVPCMAERVVGSMLSPALRPLLPPLTRVLVPHRWNNAAKVPAAAKAGWRVNIIHGLLDQIVPATMGRELHRLACAASGAGGHNPVFVEVHKAAHNDVLLRALPEYAKLMATAYVGPSR